MNARRWFSIGRIPALVAVIGLLAGSDCVPRPAGTPDAVERILQADEGVGMTEFIRVLRDGTLVDRHTALLAIDEALLQELVTAVVPFRRTLRGNVVVDVDSATVRCRDGLALVRLTARAGLGENAREPAALVIHAALRRVDFDPGRGVLLGRVEVIASGAPAAPARGIAGALNALLRDLARMRIASLEPLNLTVEIPLRLADAITLPEIGADGGEIRIPAARIPLTVTPHPVHAFGGRLWVPVTIGVSESKGAARAGTTRAESNASGSRAAVLAAPALRREHARLRAEVERRIVSDPRLRAVMSDTASVALTLPHPLLNTLVTAIARHYLDRVEVVLPAGLLDVHESGVMRVRTPLGRITAARWRMTVDRLALHATLCAGTPEPVTTTGPDRVRLALPVTLRDGAGSGRLSFRWEPTGLTRLACGPYARTLAIAATLREETFAVRGEFVLAADGDRLTAVPHFPVDRFRVAIEPTADTWRRVAVELEARDRGRCGLLFDRERATARLRKLCARGFAVTLPRAAFRTVVLPAALTRTVTVAGRDVRLSLESRALRATPEGCRYSVDVDVETHPASGRAGS